MSRNPSTRVGGQSFLSVTIIDLALDEVDRILGRVFEGIDTRRSVEGIRGTLMTRYEAPLELNYIFSGSPPRGGAHPHKLVLYEPRSVPGLTVMVVNLMDGWNSVVGLMAREHSARQVQISSTEEDAVYPKTLFQMWQGGVEVRHIMAMRDSSEWLISDRGLPLPFESFKLSSKRKSDRMNRAMLLETLNRMGWDLARSDFWETTQQAIYHEQMGTKH